jgi:hypothetical protein
VAPAPATLAPPVSGTPAAASGDPKPANPGAAPTSSIGVETGASSKKRDEYPEERILVVKAIGENHFLTDFVSHVQKPFLVAGFQRRTLNNKVQSWRPFTKRGYPKRTWAMCFSSVEDINATWAEYEDLRAAMLAQGLCIEKCKPRTKSASASGVASTCTTLPNTPVLLRRLRLQNWCPRTVHLLG